MPAPAVAGAVGPAEEIGSAQAHASAPAGTGAPAAPGAPTLPPTGIGGVGSFAAEALSRVGIGALDLFDDDKVCLTNINRQLHATHRTVGQPKVEAMKARILDIKYHGLHPQAEEVATDFYQWGALLRSVSGF